MQINLCYFNQHWNVYIDTKEGYNSWCKEPQLTTIQEEERGEFRLRKYEHPEIPIHSFGFWCFEPKQRPGHGGEWSSNSGAINSRFGLDLWEVAVDNISVAVPISWLKKVLGDQVMWEPDDIYGEIITDVAGVPNDYMRWVTLESKLNSDESSKTTTKTEEAAETSAS